MGHTRFKKKKKRWATQKAKRVWSIQSKGGAMEKTKRVQQSFDTIHDFYKLLRGLFGSGLSPNMAALQQELASATASGNQSKIVEAQTNLNNAPLRVPLYETMRAVMQYMIIRLNSIVLNIQMAEGFTDININNTTQFAKYTGYKKPGQLFFQPPGPPAVPFSKVTTSGIEIQGREYFEIPPGREWPKLQDAAASFKNLTSLLFNLDNPDQDTATMYYAALNQPLPENWQPGRLEFTAAHKIYMVCDAGANTYGKLRDFAEEAGIDIAELIELVVPLTTADSASSNPYSKHEFTFIASPAREGRPYDENVFISDANLYTSDIYEVRYEKDQWNKDTGLGFKLVVSLRNAPNTVLFELVYGILAEGQTPFVRPAGSRAQPAIYNSQGPSAAALSGCVLIRALDRRFTDLPVPPNQESKVPRVQDRIETPATAATAALRNEVVTELQRIMTENNGISPLCGTASMVDPYNRLGDRFGNFPPEVWLDIKRGGDRDQVMAAYYLSLFREKGVLKYPFIHVVTGDELAAKMAVELGLAVIYQAGGIIRYWPKMFRFRAQSRDIPPPYRIITTPPPQADQPPWAITSWGGKRMKGGLRNPNSTIPPYRYIEDKDGVHYTFDANHNFVSSDESITIQSINGRPTIIAHDIWLNPSNYVVIKENIALNPAINERLLSEIKTQYQQIRSQIPELPDRQLTGADLAEILTTMADGLSNIDYSPLPGADLAEILTTMADGLSNIDYSPLPPAIKQAIIIILQAIINVLQGIQLLQPNNSGIYQYDFLNALLFNNSTAINELDELTFRIVNDSKEDDGLEGAALIGVNSPAVPVTPDGGEAPWEIPALLDANLLEYDITFMAKRFTQTLIQYCLRQNLTIQEVRHEFITQYGIAPIVSYIQAKYVDFNLNGLETIVTDLIANNINAAITQFHKPIVSAASSSANGMVHDAAISRLSSPAFPAASVVSSSAASGFPLTQPSTSEDKMPEDEVPKFPPAPSPVSPSPLISTTPPSRQTSAAMTSQPVAMTPQPVESASAATPFASTPFAYSPSLSQTPASGPVGQAFAQTPFAWSPVGQASAITPSVTGSSSAANPATLVPPGSSRPLLTLTPARASKVIEKVHSNRRANDRKIQQEVAEAAEAAAPAAAAAAAAAPAAPVRLGKRKVGGKRHTKKKHRRKKRETQKKRSKSTSQ